jgi:hypothetical protein
MFFGFYLPAAVMAKDEDGPAVPELTRRITVCSSAHDPAAALAGVLASMPAGGIALGDIREAVRIQGGVSGLADTLSCPATAASTAAALE